MELQPAMKFIILQPWGWPFLCYLVLQLFLLWRTRRTRFIWPTLLPMPIAIYLLQNVSRAERAGHDLWSLPLTIGGAVMALYLCVIALLFLQAGKGRRLKTD